MSNVAAPSVSAKPVCPVFFRCHCWGARGSNKPAMLKPTRGKQLTDTPAFEDGMAPPALETTQLSFVGCVATVTMNVEPAWTIVVKLTGPPLASTGRLSEPFSCSTRPSPGPVSPVTVTPTEKLGAGPPPPPPPPPPQSATRIAAASAAAATRYLVHVMVWFTLSPPPRYFIATTPASRVYSRQLPDAYKVIAQPNWRDGPEPPPTRSCSSGSRSLRSGDVSATPLICTTRGCAAVHSPLPFTRRSPRTVESLTGARSPFPVTCSR